MARLWWLRLSSCLLPRAQTRRKAQSGGVPRQRRWMSGGGFARIPCATAGTPTPPSRLSGRETQNGSDRAMIDVLSRPLRRRIVREVRGAIAGSTDGSAIIGSSDDAYFPPDSIVRRVHGDVTTMMVGGISALLLQMLHPRCSRECGITPISARICTDDFTAQRAS